MALLVAGQLMGEALVAVTGLPVPGSVVGMVLVLLALLMKKGQLPELRRAGSTMLLLVPLLRSLLLMLLPYNRLHRTP